MLSKISKNLVRSVRANQVCSQLSPKATHLPLFQYVRAAAARSFANSNKEEDALRKSTIDQDYG